MKVFEKKALGIQLTQGEQTYLILLKTIAATIAVAVFNAASQFIANHGTSFDWMSLSYTVLIAALIAAILAGLTYFEAQPISPQNALVVEVLQAILSFLQQMPAPSASQPLQIHVHMADGSVQSVILADTQTVPAVSSDLSKQ